MNEPTKEELKILLKAAYDCVPSRYKGTTRCIDYDPAGSTYEFTEHQWSVRIREIFGYNIEPTGI